jgi:hypothetical protein
MSNNEENLPPIIIDAAKEVTKFNTVALQKLRTAKPRPWPWIFFALLLAVVLSLSVGLLLHALGMLDSFWKGLFTSLTLLICGLLTPFWIVAACWWTFEKRDLERNQREVKRSHKCESIRAAFLRKRSAYDFELAVLRSQKQTAPPVGLERVTGLPQFSTWVVDAIDSQTKQVHLAVNTPLLHCLHWPAPKGQVVMPYARLDRPTAGHGADNWARMFCGPLAIKLNQCADKANLDFLFLYLDPDTQRQSIRWFPFFEKNPFADYTRQIEAFKTDVVTALNKPGTELDTVFQETDMIPMWIAVIKGGTVAAPTSQVVLALTGPDDLNIGSREENGKSVESLDLLGKKEFAHRVADGVVVLRSGDPEIVKFFDDVFRRLTLRNYRVVNMLRSLLREGEHGGLDVMFSADFSDHKHGHLKVMDIKAKDVIYACPKQPN